MKELWLFDEESLQPGDVVLESGDGVFSHAIKFVEWGEFSHALLWLGDGDFLEAVEVGARFMSIKRVVIDDTRRWAVLRYKSDPSVGVRAAKQARNLAHMPYGWAGAFASKLPLLSSFKSSASLFCSELAAVSYEKAGLRIVPGVDSAAVTPKALQKESVLELVETKFQAIGEFDTGTADRDEAWLGSLTYADLIASQLALERAIPLLPEGSTKPGNLVQLYELIGPLPGSVTEPISAALIEVFQEHRYFELIEDQLKVVLAFLRAAPERLRTAGADDQARAKAELIRLSQSYASAAERHAGLAEKYDTAHANTGLGHKLIKGIPKRREQ